MSSPTAAELERECSLFCRYLADIDATPEMIKSYQHAHEIDGLRLSSSTPLDRSLMTLAGGGAALTRIADSFAGVIAPASALRRKLVILIAILESCSPSASKVEIATPGSRAAWVVSSAVYAAGWLLRVVVAAVLLSPLRLWYGIAASR